VNGYQDDVYDTVVQGNTASHNVGVPGVLVGDGIVVYNCHSNTIIDNTCEGNAGSGISLGEGNWPLDWPRDPDPGDSYLYDSDDGYENGFFIATSSGQRRIRQWPRRDRALAVP